MQTTSDEAPGLKAGVSADGYRITPDQETTGWPPGVPYIVGNEACERSCFVNFFWTFAALSSIAGVLFGVRAYFYMQKDYTQE